MTTDELDVLRAAAIQRQQRKAIVDETAGSPVRFWCDRYKELKFMVNGKRRKFVNGQFLAETKNRRGPFAT